MKLRVLLICRVRRRTLPIVHADELEEEQLEELLKEYFHDIDDIGGRSRKRGEDL